jgi:acetolactate synthase I/II/III large subunit
LKKLKSAKPARVSCDAPMSGGEAIVRSLIENGVDTVFGIPGAQIYSLFDALHQASDRITTYGARHEQGAAWPSVMRAQRVARACSRWCRGRASSMRPPLSPPRGVVASR